MLHKCCTWPCNHPCMWMRLSPASAKPVGGSEPASDGMRAARERRGVWEARLAPGARVLGVLAPAVRGEAHPGVAAGVAAAAALACVGVMIGWGR
jgi:hypothetical protein